MNVTIRELVGYLKGELTLGDPKAVVTRAVVDSRSATAGDAFFALKGDKTDGHAFAQAACAQGASAVVVSNLDWLSKTKHFSSAVVRVDDPMAALRQLAHVLRDKFTGPVVGITGSNGKTTTKQMTSNVLKALGPGLSTKGNLNSQIGMPMVLSELQDTDRWMVLEMGASEPGNIAALADVARPTIGVISSIGIAHLKSFGSLPNIARTKWELIESLPRDGCAIVPWGEPNLENHIRTFSKKLIFFGEDSACAVRASAVQMGERINFMLQLANRSSRVSLPVSGRFNVNNALAAAAVGWALNVPFEKIVEGLETFEPPKMRMEVTRHPSEAVLINDAYNANPTSMLHSVRSLMEAYPAQRKVLVLGSMLELGDESEKMHFHLGTELGRFALDQVFLLGDETEQIQEGAVSVGSTTNKFFKASSAEEIADKLRAYLKPNTVVLFKGSRGMQLERVIQGIN